MDRFDAMSAFVAVADRESFTAAARHLGLAPSAVTRLIAGLEERLGVRLLQRTTRSMTLTDAGVRYLERARRILLDLDEAENAAASERLEPVGRLVVSAPLNFGRLHVAPLMATFLDRYPQATAQLLFSDRFDNLVEEGIDLAVRIGHLPDSGLIARSAGATRRVVVASPDYLARRGVPQRPLDVGVHDIIHLLAIEEMPVWRFSHGEAEERIAVTPRLSINSAEAAVEQAVRGGGLTMVLGYQAADAVREGRLEIVLAAFEKPVLPIHLVYPASRLLAANVRTFVEMALATCDWDFAGERTYAANQ